MRTVQRRARCLVAGELHEGTIDGDHFVHAGARVSLASASFAAPCTPSKIIGVGRNYAGHAAELNNPLPPEPLLFN